MHTGGEKEDGTYEGGTVNFTGQLFFDDDVAAEIFALEPYSQHSGSYTKLADDMVYEDNGAAGGLLTLKAVHKKDPSKGYKGSIVLGIDPDAESTGAGSGGGGTPPAVRRATRRPVRRRATPRVTVPPRPPRLPRRVRA